ncbi:superoxide dismutase, partial [Paenibacillus riograndensis]
MAFQLPALPYPNNALEPHIDALTMEIHHDRHHNTYVTNLNAALEKAPELQGKSIKELLTDLNAIPDAIRTDIRNNGGGHATPTMLWEVIAPNGGGAATRALAHAHDTEPRDFDKFKEDFATADNTRWSYR